MSSLQRFLSQKAYEWERHRIRTQHKKGRTGGGNIGLPHIVGFKIEGNKVTNASVPKRVSQSSRRRGRREGEIDLKKVAGIALIAIGCLLLLTKCFGGEPKEEAVTKQIQEESYEEVQLVAEPIQDIPIKSFEEYIQDFEIVPDTLHMLFKQATKYRTTFAHTLSVWALESYGGKTDAQLFRTLKKGAMLVQEESYEVVYNLYKQFIYDIEAFPLSNPKDYAYKNGWKEKRSYKGERLHYGIDMMATEAGPGVLKVLSMTDGTVENIGWNEVGGYRVGIRSNGGAYFYYAHLSELPTHIQKGQQVYAGDWIGYMGDTGYGEEGTRGKFPVHLHVGIAVKKKGNQEYWINPYSILTYLEKYGMQ